MEFRLSREDEYSAVRKLWGQAFGEEEPWTSWYFAHHYRADLTWVGVEAGKVVAQAHLLPHRLRVRNCWLDTVYFVGVCVEENLRGTGIGRAVMASALAELNRTGFSVSILQPRWPEFYRKLGWDYCYSRQRYSSTLTEAKRLLPTALTPYHWTPDEEMRAPIVALYEDFVKMRHGYALRAAKDWDILLADHRGEGGCVGVVSREGSPVGYVLYHSLGSLLHVREMVWCEPGIMDVAWSFLAEQVQSEGVETIEWDDPSCDQGSVLYAGSRSEPFLMGRVADLPSALETIAYPLEVSVEIDLTVTDELAPWNQGSYHWSVQKGQGRLSPLQSAASAGLSLGIAVISQLIFGERSVCEILAAGKGSGLREEEIALLEQIFPACHNFISEYF